MTLGVIVSLRTSMEEEFQRIRDFGLNHVQLCTWNPSLYSDELAAVVAEQMKRLDIHVTTFWAGYSGEVAWNFTRGPETLGLVPQPTRSQRVDDLCRASDFAKALGVEQIATHMGFIPEVGAYDAQYEGIIAAIRQVAQHCKRNGQWLLFETGQETPTTLARCFADVGEDNLGINLDPANLILYGKANAVDAVDLLGPWVRDVHAKDGLYPTDGRNLGNETRIGDGKVNFPALLTKLHQQGYDGPITIEREISGEEQDRDIRYAVEFLSGIMASW